MAKARFVVELDLGDKASQFDEACAAGVQSRLELALKQVLWPARIRRIEEPDDRRRHQIVELARQYESEGELELDDEDQVIISEGDDNGAYVQMWRWVDFAGTELCEDPDYCHGGCKKHG